MFSSPLKPKPVEKSYNPVDISTDSDADYIPRCELDLDV
jgi:hypothetical protein